MFYRVTDETIPPLKRKVNLFSVIIPEEHLWCNNDMFNPPQQMAAGCRNIFLLHKIIFRNNC